MATLLTIIHISVALFLIVIVLLQHGKGADMGAAFGGGSSQTLFGTEGPMPLMNKITTSAAIIFMLTSVSLAYLSSHQTKSVMRSIQAPPPVEETAPPQGVTIPMPTEGGAEAPPAPAAPPAGQTTAQ
ncbi:MAG: preprotein translocase subunit SecG [Deltaproteobacteria bacterium CG23_combo_of_CG06-09_8_20_14_all_60_8]|nr:MAG: preprotein translocase subunit SecG [Deltaproteobacteria bacterium CG23_combo_of_CG06-09_8_20_14_all_60_8]